jgi:protein-S-isoprenylcysteine O-methyltransferase Ste14
VSDAATMKFASSRRLHYEELERLPDGLFVCGDALASFNPTFGQGMTVAALQLELLESMGRDSAEPGANRRFLQQASAIVDVAWNTAAGRAFTYEGVRGRPTAAMRISNAYVPRVIARALSDVSVATALLRTMHFMAPPSSLFAPAILAKVLAPFAKRLAVLAYGVVAYALGASALLGWMLAMFGVVQFTGGPLGQLATGPALVLDLTLLVAFALQHSVMARPAWKARWLHVVGPALERPTYVLTTGAVLLPALWLWQPMPTVIWSLQNPVAIGVAHAVAVSAWIYLYVASFAIDHFELFGLRQVWCFFVDRPIVPVRFRERWMYRFDRHPIMTGALFGMWMTPTMMLDHLTFALGFSLYIVVGVFFEERSMRAQWGAPYEDYCERVGTIVPRVRFRARSTEGAPCDLPSGAVVGPKNPG